MSSSKKELPNTPMHEFHGFMAERPYVVPEPNEIRDHHAVYNFLISEESQEGANRVFRKLLGAFGLTAVGVIRVDEHLVQSIEGFTDEDGVLLVDTVLEPGLVLQFDYARQHFALIKLEDAA